MRADPGVVFGLGTGRCGSLSLATSLVLYFAEVRHEGQLLGRPGKSFRGVTWPEVLAERTERVSRQRSYLDVDNRLSERVLELAEAFPGARFIHQVRDPVEVVWSFIAKGYRDDDAGALELYAGLWERRSRALLDARLQLAGRLLVVQLGALAGAWPELLRWLGIDGFTLFGHKNARRRLDGGPPPSFAHKVRELTPTWDILAHDPPFLAV